MAAVSTAIGAGALLGGYIYNERREGKTRERLGRQRRREEVAMQEAQETAVARRERVEARRRNRRRPARRAGTVSGGGPDLPMIGGPSERIG